MAVVFITGMSGVGKSAVLDHLRNMGYNAVDTDYDYVLEIQGRDGTERYWDIEKVASLLEEHMQVLGYRESRIPVGGTHAFPFVSLRVL